MLETPKKPSDRDHLPPVKRAKRPYHELIILGVFLMITGAVLAFFKLADLAQDKDHPQMDLIILKFFRHADQPEHHIGPEWLLESMRDITALGGATVITMVSIASLIFLGMRGRTGHMLLLLFAVIGGTLVSSFLKNWIGRERPDVVPHLTTFTSASFPSGHSLLSAVTYLTLGAILSKTAKTRSEKVFFLGLALFLTFIIGLSRVFLGVHFPTDVLAGWSAGFAWATICYLFAVWLQKRGRLKQDELYRED